jgi:hypothetical protein
VDERHFESVEKHRKTVLPNLRAIVKKDTAPSSGTPWCYGPPEYWAELYIFRNTTLATLISILSHSVQWICHDGRRVRSCVNRFFRVDVTAGATLGIGDTAIDSPWEPLRNSTLTVTIHQEEGEAVAQLQRITRTLEAIRRLTMPAAPTTGFSQEPLEGSPAGRPDVTFRVEYPEPAELEVWLTQVSVPKGRLQKLNSRAVLQGAGMVGLGPQIGGPGLATLRQSRCCRLCAYHRPLSNHVRKSVAGRRPIQLLRPSPFEQYALLLGFQ